MTPLGTKIATWFSGRFIGADEFGNRYYEQKYGARHGNTPKRWVIYRGIAEPSKVPPQWHGWLHYTHAAPLATGRRYGWQKEHQPNLTGTNGRYLPQGHLLKSGKRARATADYKPWTPE